MTYADSKSRDELFLQGEREGRQDKARAWGMRDTRNMDEHRAQGYRCGYYGSHY